MLKSFTRNYEDNSTDAGFQFTFYCDICHDGYRSSFIESSTYKKGKGLRGLAQGASILGSLVGGAVSNIGYGMELSLIHICAVPDYLGDRCTYALQDKRLGSGHAVMMAEDLLKDYKYAVVLAGDMPLVRESSLEKLITLAEAGDYSALLLTGEVENPTGYGLSLIHISFYQIDSPLS